MTQVLGKYEGAAGVYISWDYLSETGSMDHFYITRADHVSGTYTGVATVAYPISEYVDQNGDLSSYYIIHEQDASGTTIATHQPLWGDEIMLRSSLAYELDWLMRTPVYREEPIFVNDERTIAKVAAWGQINYWPRPQLYISAKQDDGDRSPMKIIPMKGETNLDNKGDDTEDYAEIEWYVDFNNRIYFIDADGAPVSIDWADQIQIDYTFQAVTPSEMNDAIYLAACDIVAQPGVDKYSRCTSPRNIGNLPRRWDAALVDGAAYRILRRLALSLNQQERRLVFQNWQVEGDDPTDRLLNQAKEYREKFDEEKQLIAREKYPDSAMYVTQEWMMPGSRSRFFRMSFAATNY